MTKIKSTKKAKIQMTNDKIITKVKILIELWNLNFVWTLDFKLWNFISCHPGASPKGEAQHHSW